MGAGVDSERGPHCRGVTLRGHSPAPLPGVGQGPTGSGCRVETPLPARLDALCSAATQACAYTPCHRVPGSLAPQPHSSPDTPAWAASGIRRCRRRVSVSDVVGPCTPLKSQPQGHLFREAVPSRPIPLTSACSVPTCHTLLSGVSWGARCSSVPPSPRQRRCRLQATGPGATAAAQSPCGDGRGLRLGGRAGLGEVLLPRAERDKEARRLDQETARVVGNRGLGHSRAMEPGRRCQVPARPQHSPDPAPCPRD